MTMSRDKSLRDQPNATHLSKIELTEEELNRVSGGGMSSVSAAINTIGKALASSASKG
jgi:bacteriocin-like protein